jgi:hypothetical protein
MARAWMVARHREIAWVGATANCASLLKKAQSHTSWHSRGNHMARIGWGIWLLLGCLPATLDAARNKAVTAPILFVTQYPIAGDFASIGSTFANHRADMQTSGRGGDLYIRYGNGVLRNLTAEAGFGMTGLQGANAISVRDPEVHFSGTKAIFSMVIGAPEQFEYNDYYWQLYEVTGFGSGQSISITKVANQPLDYNNIQPTYASDDSIIYVSDRPRSGERHLYPQHDEYESTATPTGLWKLNPTSGALILLQHSPSGSFDPLLDSSGRVIFTRWDHLQRDQQADVAGNPSGNFNWASEAQNAAILPAIEVFPEPRIAVPGSAVNGHTLNLFLPWMIRQDGTDEETVNHVGRHELQTYFNRSLEGDNNLREFIAEISGRVNPNSMENIFHLQEDPAAPGTFLGIDAPEFGTHGAGQIVRFGAAAGSNPDLTSVVYLTPRSTRGTAVAPDHSGHYRNPIKLADGTLIAAHDPTIGEAGNNGTRANPDPRYKFRLQRLALNGATLEPVEALTPGNGISKTLSFYDPDVLVTYNGPLWELSPVEVRARPVPPQLVESVNLATPEAQAFADEQVNPVQFRNFLRNRGLALLVMRNVTTRDQADKQQPFNLRVPGGAQTLGAGGTIYDISHFQMFQGDQIRGIGGSANPNLGRRVIAQAMHDSALGVLNLPNASGPAGSVPIASDGSVAVIVPTRRALSWQSTATDGTPVVRERFWITAQPGEIRTCDGCHGVNSRNQANQAGAAQNSAIALRLLLARWKLLQGELFVDGFE